MTYNRLAHMFKKRWVPELECFENRCDQKNTYGNALGVCARQAQACCEAPEYFVEDAAQIALYPDNTWPPVGFAIESYGDEYQERYRYF